MSASVEQGFLSIANAAVWADVSVRTINRWIEKGLSVRQAGPREKVLVKPSDIEAFLTGRQAPRSDLNTLVDEVIKSFGGAKNK